MDCLDYTCGGAVPARADESMVIDTRLSTIPAFDIVMNVACAEAPCETGTRFVRFQGLRYPRKCNVQRCAGRGWVAVVTKSGCDNVRVQITSARPLKSPHIAIQRTNIGIH